MNRALTERVVCDLRQMVPEDMEITVLDGSVRFMCGPLGGETYWLEWMTDCDWAERLVSEAQDAVGDLKSEWWPMVGRKRLGYRIECVDGRPELVLFLESRIH